MSEEKYPIGPQKCETVASYNTLPLDDTQPMRFEAHQISMAIIFLQGTGTITQDTPNEFERFMATSDAKMSKWLFLHSPGGDLMAGLKLGEAIRKHQLNTGIGRSVMLEEGTMLEHSYKHAVCASSCAYAFLGGVSRTRFGFLFTGTICCRAWRCRWSDRTGRDCFCSPSWSASAS